MTVKRASFQPLLQGEGEMDIILPGSRTTPEVSSPTAAEPRAGREITGANRWETRARSVQCHVNHKARER